MNKELRKKISATIRYIILLFVGLLMLYPLIWLFTATFKENYEIFGNINLWPKNNFTDWSNWRLAWDFPTGYNILYHFTNTLKYLLPRTFFTVVSSVITAYTVSRLEFKGRKAVFAIIIATLLIPAVIYRIPMYLFYVKLNLHTSFVPLYLDAAFAFNSFFIFMLIQFFRTIPRELDEAAMIDGCNKIQILWYVLVPVLKPIIITVALLTFMWGMNDFLGPLIYLTKPDMFPLSVALRTAVAADEAINYARLYAMSFMALLPPIVIFAFSQRYFIEGIATSGSKG